MLTGYLFIYVYLSAHTTKLLDIKLWKKMKNVVPMANRVKSLKK